VYPNNGTKEFVNINLFNLPENKDVSEWFALRTSDGDVGKVKIDLKYTVLYPLTTSLNNEVLDIILDASKQDELFTHVHARQKAEFCDSIIQILCSHNLLQSTIKDIVKGEILMYREYPGKDSLFKYPELVIFTNSGTCGFYYITEFLKRFGKQYLRRTLGESILKVYRKTETFEIIPSKIGIRNVREILNRNWTKILDYSEGFIQSITTSAASCPRYPYDLKLTK
jgi:hypothetical protein